MQILRPTDVVVAPEFTADAPATVVPADRMPADQLGLVNDSKALGGRS